MKKRVVNILGTKWTIEYLNKDHKDLEGNEGMICYYKPTIYINDDNVPEMIRHAVRHEIIHAFKHESGLRSCEVLDDEQQTDWVATQLSKIYEVYKKLGVE